VGWNPVRMNPGPTRSGCASGRAARMTREDCPSGRVSWSAVLPATSGIGPAGNARGDPARLPRSGSSALTVPSSSRSAFAIVLRYQVTVEGANPSSPFSSQSSSPKLP
jgi:hypothetical protein